MNHHLAGSLCLLGLLSLGCGRELGSCDPARSRRVVYDRASGEPAFEGQALMNRSCGSGGFCHSPGISPQSRRGAPIGLDYDLRLASNTERAEPESTERLRSMQRRAFEERHNIWDQVLNGWMPVPGDVSQEVLEAAPVYDHLDIRAGVRRPMPSLADEGGREMLRNWLACGLPVVERTEPASDDEDPVPEVGYVVSLQEEPLEPRWADIYERLMVTRCSSRPCHGAAAAGGLDLTGERESLQRLTGSRPVDSEYCGAVPGAWIVPGDAEGSLLFQKLAGVDAAGDPVCGEPMPQSGARLSTTSLENVRRWIDEGATE